jgi:hypothetical protein
MVGSLGIVSFDRLYTANWQEIQVAIEPKALGVLRRLQHTSSATGPPIRQPEEIVGDRRIDQLSKRRRTPPRFLLANLRQIAIAATPALRIR